MSTLLHPADVLNAPADSFQFYGLLPSDGCCLADNWPRDDLRQAMADADVMVPERLDRLTLALLAHGAAPLPGDADWLGLADRFARGYADQLRPGGQRALRMRLMRLNFMLRDMLDRDLPADEIVAERRLLPFTWDWVPANRAEWLADSGKQENVHRIDACGTRQSRRLGLPTQLEALRDGSIATGSCYSDGWYSWAAGGEPEFFARSRPIVLVFEHDGTYFELDADGRVRRSGADAVLAQLPLQAVWCARKVGSLVVASDWGEAGQLAMLDLNSWNVAKVSSGPVLLTNDICLAGEKYYILDKMQGRVFAFGLDFSPVSARMAFGKAPGRLYDPISIRAHGGNLHVLSWITGALVTIRPF